jgi:hypothetical protein
MALFPKACADRGTLLLDHSALVCYRLGRAHVPDELLHYQASVHAMGLQQQYGHTRSHRGGLEDPTPEVKLASGSRRGSAGFRPRCVGDPIRRAVDSRRSFRGVDGCCRRQRAAVSPIL